MRQRLMNYTFLVLSCLPHPQNVQRAFAVADERPWLPLGLGVAVLFVRGLSSYHSVPFHSNHEFRDADGLPTDVALLSWSLGLQTGDGMLDQATNVGATWTGR